MMPSNGTSVECGARFQLTLIGEEGGLAPSG